MSLVLGCKTSDSKIDDPAAPAPPIVAPVPTIPEPVAAEQAAPEPEPAPEPLSIGWGRVSVSPTREGARGNSRALAIFREGDLEGALAGFHAAAEASPGYAWPRYNAACALARLGRAREAAEWMRPLLVEDFPQFRGRFLHDADLAALRASPEGAALRELLPRVAAAYGEALMAGTPAFVYAEREEWRGDIIQSDTAQTPYKELRIGVYDHQHRRFVPMVPEVDDAHSGVLDRELKRAVVASGPLAMKDMWVVQPHRASATVFSLTDFGDVVLRASDVSPADTVLYGFELWLAPDDTLYGVQYGVGYAPQNDYFRWTHTDHKKIGWTHEDTWRRKPPAEVPFDRPSLKVYERASARYPASTGARVRRGVVSYEGVEGKVTLGPGHHEHPTLHASPDPMLFVVASFHAESYDERDGTATTTPARHVIDRVDMHEQRVTRLATTPGHTAVIWAPDGTLFLDTPKEIQRYAPGSTEPVHDVLPGVHFATPPFPRSE